ncbi:MAG: DUF2071 domain-containing protein [Thermoanaerobaculia bacterium]
MLLATEVRDCLYLNWALAPAALPPLPEGLGLDLQVEDGVTHAFVSLLCFRQANLATGGLTLPGLTFPQANLRLYVRDAEGVPSVYFVRMLLPIWMVPAARGLARQPASPAVFDFPARVGVAGEWTWRVETGGAEARVTAHPGAPACARAPRFGGWERAVEFFRHRPRGYARLGGRLRRSETVPPAAESTPLVARVLRSTWLERLLPGVGAEVWGAPHSAFLCPRLPLELEVETWRRPALAVEVPQPG